MAEIVSLNQYRKARQKIRSASRALQKRVRHGRTDVEENGDQAERDRQAQSYDRKRLERTEPNTDPE